MKKLIGLIIIIVVFGISIYLILKIPKSVNGSAYFFKVNALDIPLPKSREPILD